MHSHFKPHNGFRVIYFALFSVVFLIIFFRNFSAGRSLSYSKTAFVLLLFALLLMFLLYLYKRTYLIIGNIKYLFILCFIFFISLFSSVFGSYIKEWTGVINNFAQQILFLILTSLTVNFFIRKRLSFLSFLGYILYSFSLLTAIVGWQVIFFGKGFFGRFSFSPEGIENFRLISFHDSSNYAGLAIAYGIISLCYLKFRIKDFNSFIFFISLFFLIVSLFATGSRGSLVLATLGLVIFYNTNLFKISKYIKREFFVGIFLLICILIIVNRFFNLSDFLVSFDRVLDRFQSLKDLDSLNHDPRALFFKAGIDKFWDASFFEIVFGFGNGAYQFYFGRSPHNSYLAILFDFGLLTFLLLVMLIGYVSIVYIRKFIRNNAINNFSRLFIAAILVMSLIRGFVQAGEVLGFSLNWIVFLMVSSYIISFKKLE